MPAKSSNARIGWRDWLWLGIAVSLALFSNGRWVIPAAAWLAPLFFLRFIHRQKLVSGLAASASALIVVYLLSWQGMTPLRNDPGLYFLVFTGIAITFWLPYCADRLLAPRIRGFASTLVFPLAMVAVELLYSLFNPFMSWGSWAYTQASWLALIQIVSLTGIWGLTFLIAWFGSVFRWAWEQDFAGPLVCRGLCAYLAVLAGVLCYGEARLAWFKPQAETVRVGSVAATSHNIAALEAAEDNPALAAGNFQGVLDDYLARTRRLAQAGAQIVVWDELAIRTSDEDKTAVIQQGRSLAVEQRIYLVMALWVELPSDSRTASRINSAVLIGPDGSLLWEYVKAHPTPGSRDVAGNGRLASATTPLGNLSAAICYDMDDPGLLRQAGQNRAAILLVPTWDNPATEDLHMSMALFRAIENGFSLVRSTRGGYSAAFDGQGRLLAISGQNTVDRTLIADVPGESQWTLYPVVGDMFGWLNLAGFALLAGMAIIKPPRGRLLSPA